MFKPEPQPNKIIGRGLIMKVLTSRKVIQLSAEFGEATGITLPIRENQFVAYFMINMCI